MAEIYPPIAQLAEQLPLKEKVEGSIPSGRIFFKAEVAKLADALALGASARKGMGVQISPSAHLYKFFSLCLNLNKYSEVLKEDEMKKMIVLFISIFFICAVAIPCRADENFDGFIFKSKAVIWKSGFVSNIPRLIDETIKSLVEEAKLPYKDIIITSCPYKDGLVLIVTIKFCKNKNETTSGLGSPSRFFFLN